MIFPEPLRRLYALSVSQPTESFRWLTLWQESCCLASVHP